VRSNTRKTITATVVADRYRLEGELARGGMGTVWLARDVKLGRRVAIKVLAQELAQMSEAQQRFEREAQALAQLRSTHIVEVYDFGVQEGLPFIVMELLEGENLGQRLKRIGCLGVEDATVVVYQMCKGLKAAHAAGLIHRDLKPSNIFLARRDDVEVVKLLDFGVVKAMDTIGQTDATVSGMLLGTPQYMSPEQARATREIDHRSDLWSAAVIAFRCLTGQNPFRGESVGDVVLKICSDTLPKITDYRPDLPRSLDEFFERAFARAPDERFQGASEMADGFQRALAAGWATQRAQTRATTTSGMNLQSYLATPASGMPSALPTPVSQPSLPPSESSGSHPSFGNGPVSATAPFPSPATISSLAPSTLTPPSFPSAVPAPPPSFDGVVAEPTPVSTTVAGTQLASAAPVRPRPLATQPLTIVVGAAAALITLGLVLAIWFGTSSPGAPAAAATSAPSSAPIPAVAPEEDEPAEEAPATAPASGEGANLDENIPPVPPRDPRPPEVKSAAPPPPKSSAAPSVTPPPPKKDEKKDKPKEKDKGRPSWF
jgi:serine/threonine-protein kinase